MTFSRPLLALTLLAASLPCFAGSITTTFSSNNGHNGNMFDVVTNGNSVDITGFDINTDTSGQFAIYTRSGSYANSPESSDGWTQVFSGSVTSQGHDAATPISGLNILLAANSTTGFYLTFVDGNILNYTNGSDDFSNADLTVTHGLGKAYPFGASFSPREWNGTINYNVETSAVPEPGSLALMGTGVLGVVGAARRKFNF
jgi:trimeric autotransporter adhesin